MFHLQSLYKESIPYFKFSSVSGVFVFMGATFKNGIL